MWINLFPYQNLFLLVVTGWLLILYQLLILSKKVLNRFSDMEQIRRMSMSDTYVTDSCPEPYEFNLHPQSYSLKSILIQYFHLNSYLPYSLLPSDFPTKTGTLFIIFETY